ncbi:hypothetical protein ACOQFV_07565 [Nocardiopsis changdeensis]|uniref:ParA family protein n=1 Tax=Nocardiopsis changdeensis TaxID=2831969 RepID=A0ABX8BEK2_9ACTN|nr:MULTISPECIES: hypothetical protein [Nocardiopsis]QUX20576.1 hypothetical protein KGD84_18905 [Nocardiopsis changdeensis]QYX36507.1 hypothetical protein K1J57_28360 [Nocardiopsis sp. MT53]
MTTTRQPPVTLVGVQRGGADKTSATVDLGAFLPAADDPDQPRPTLVDDGHVVGGRYGSVVPGMADDYDRVVLDPPPLFGPSRGDD